MLARHRRIQHSADSKNRIPDRFCIQCLARKSPQQNVRGISLKVAFMIIAGQLVRPTEHDRAMQRFDIPACFHKPRGQPVEQFRMRWQLATRSEVTGCRHKATAKVPLPDAIHEHACGQRIGRSSQPFDQLTSTASCRRLRNFIAAQYFQKSTRHFIAGLIRFPAFLNSSVDRRAFADSIGHFISRRCNNRVAFFCQNG